MIEKLRNNADPDAIEGALEQIQELEDKLPEIPVSPRAFCDDITPEALAAFMEKQGETAAIMEAEGGIFEILSGLYSSGRANLNLILKAWCGEAVTVDRRNRGPLILRHPTLTFCLAIQPEVLRDIAAKPGFRGKGVLGRFLYCIPRSLLGRRPVETSPVSDTLTAKYKSMILSIIDAPPATNEFGEPVPFDIILSSGAYQLWVSFAERVERELRPGGEFENVLDWAGKLPGQAVRLAGILHVAGESDPVRRPISAETMDNALKLAAALSDHALLAFDEMGADPAVECAKRILKWITETKPIQFSARDSFEAVKGRYSKMEMIHHGLKILVDRAYIRGISSQERKGPGQKPSPVFETNPYAHNSHNSQN